MVGTRCITSLVKSVKGHQVSVPQLLESDKNHFVRRNTVGGEMSNVVVLGLELFDQSDHFVAS